MERMLSDSINPNVKEKAQNKAIIHWEKIEEKEPAFKILLDKIYEQIEKECEF